MIQLQPVISAGFTHPGQADTPMSGTDAEGFVDTAALHLAVVSLVDSKDLPHLTQNDLVYAARIAQGNLEFNMADEPEPEGLVYNEPIDEIIVDFDEE